MSIYTKEAKSLCSVSEWKLVQESQPANIGSFTLSQIKTKAAAVRRLQNKWRDMSRKQKRASKDMDVGARTYDKIKLFDEVYKVFEKQKRKIEREMSVEKNRKRKKLMKKTDTAFHRAKEPNAWPETGHEAKKNKKIGIPKTIQSHISARNRRAQAKRDSR